MRTQAPPRGVIAVALIFTATCLGMMLLVWTTLGGHTPLEARQWRITADFSDASQLVTGADVRISGVHVGRVATVEPHGLQTRAIIEIDHEYAPLPRDTQALLRQKTLLGETFVALTPGHRARGTFHDGDTLPADQIEARQPLDRILGALTERTRTNLVALLTGTSRTLRGRSTDLNNALGNLDPVTAQLKTMSLILDHQSGNVRSLVSDTGTVLGAVSARDSDVAGLVNHSADVLRTTATRNHALTATLRATPAMLTELRRTSAALDHAAALATPALRALRPVARSAPATLHGLADLAPRATRLFTTFGKLLPTARRALPAAGQIVSALGPFTATLAPAARNLVPLIDLLDRYRGELTASMANVAAATDATSPDSLGVQRHYLRALVPITEEGLTGAARRQPTNRHNAYPAPGAWNAIGRDGLAASDCRNTTNPQTEPVVGTGAPTCRVQGPFTFDGASGYFPAMAPARP